MSGRIVGEILDNAPEDLTQLELCVLVAIAEEAREKDRTALYNTSADAIAYRTRSTPSSVRNVLARLKERGLIVALNDKVHRGHAQQYALPKMGPHTREATWTEHNGTRNSTVTQSPLKRATTK